MVVINMNDEGSKKWKDLTMQEVYSTLIDGNIETYEDAEINTKKLFLILSWLPSIDIIEVDRDWDDTWLNIVFSNGERINNIYNIGIEYALCCLVEK